MKLRLKDPLNGENVHIVMTGFMQDKRIWNVVVLIIPLK